MYYFNYCQVSIKSKIKFATIRQLTDQITKKAPKAHTIFILSNSKRFNLISPYFYYFLLSRLFKPYRIQIRIFHFYPQTDRF